MRQIKRVAITVEISRLIVRQRMSQTHVWCTRCSAHVQSVRLEAAAALIGVSTSTIDTQTEAGEYHFVEEVGSDLICLNSLFASIDKQDHD
jgi:hypothetical protein